MRFVNSWMAFPTFDAQCAHVLAGYAAITTARAYWPRHLLLTYFICIGLAALKEFWFDARYELPKQEFADNALDFAFYFLGLVVGMLCATV